MSFKFDETRRFLRPFLLPLSLYESSGASQDQRLKKRSVHIRLLETPQSLVGVAPWIGLILKPRFSVTMISMASS